MSQIDLSPTVRKRLEKIDYQTAIANQGFLRSRQLSQIGPTGHDMSGGRKAHHAGMEMVSEHHVHGYEAPHEYVREYTVREHVVAAHDSHSKSGKVIHVPEEVVKKHVVHAHERKAHAVHGYEQPAHEVPMHHAHHGAMSPHIADLTSRLHKMEMEKAHGKKPHHKGGMMHHTPDSGRQSPSSYAYEMMSEEGGSYLGGAVLGGAVLGGRHRKTDRPLNAYQLYQKEHMHIARQEAEAEGLIGREAAHEALRKVAAMWRAHKA